MTNFDYDLLIIGGGAAGLTAAIYAVRYNLKTVVVSADFGGQILNTGEIENWPGTKSITGGELSKAYEEHARSLGAELVTGYVKSITSGEGFSVELEDKTLKVKSVILTSGAKHKKLGIKGEEEFSGRGVSYCATCDGPFFKNKVVAVVGGGDAGVTGAIDLTANASKVYLINRSESFRAKPAYVDALKKNPKVEVILNTNVVEAKGAGKLTTIALDKPYNGAPELLVDGLFIEIGFLPETTIVKELGIEFDEQGYIKVEKDQATNIKGLFAAGDVTDASNRFAQLVTAASEGAIAAEAAFRYIQDQNS